jgi:diaminopimelate epimerase
MTDGIASLQFVTDSGNISTVINGEQVKVEIPFSEEFTEFILKDGSKVYKGITGVPHAVKLVNRVENVDINEAGKQIRFAECFAPAGANVDFIQVPLEPTDPVLIRTYERGVEAETNACGTGICAAAIVLNRFFDFGNKIKFLTPDKELLTVDLEIKDKVIVKVFLTGPAVEVYRGELLEMQ